MTLSKSVLVQDFDMQRYWVSWLSDCDEECRTPPFQVWIRCTTHTLFCRCIYAVLDADNEKQVWKIIRIYYPDCLRRFCVEREEAWEPSSNDFPNFKNNTLIWSNLVF